MNVANGFRRVISLVLLAVSTLAANAQAQSGADREAADAAAALRWAPHRAAATVTESGPTPTAPATLEPVPMEDQELAADMVESQQPPLTRAPASYRVPGPRTAPDAAAGAGMPRRSVRAAPQPGRGAPERPTDGSRLPPAQNRAPGAPRGTAAGDGETSLFAMNFFRVPQGDVGRPILAREIAPQRGAVRPAAASGGESFRPSPRQVGVNNPRLAMAPEVGSSVMSRPPTSSMPRARVPARRVANQPTPAGELPSPTSLPAESSPRSRGPVTMGTPPPAMEDMAGDGELSFGGSAGDLGFGDMPMNMGDGGMSDPTLGDPSFGGYEGGYGDGYEGGYEGGYGDDGMYGDAGRQRGMRRAPQTWSGDYQLHIPSFFDDPYACEDNEACPGCSPIWDQDGRICAYMRRFGRPYYGWRWYRDFTASAGVTSFQNTSDLGIHGNFGFNEYANWAMPFWNAFGVGWQMGIRGVQADFQPTQVRAANGNTIFNNQARNQVFFTTGFFTRAFEGRGIQGGAVWDYLQNNWYDTSDLSQVRGELSYVWGYHEFGVWGAYNTSNSDGIFVNGSRALTYHDTLDVYTGFYRLQFGDANEMKIWGGVTGQGDTIVGTLVRAPMSRSLALEGTFTYLIPRTANTVTLPAGGSVNYSEQAWNVSTNLVWYPACRARRSLASPYRPLFEVADNGSMIQAITVTRTKR